MSGSTCRTATPVLKLATSDARAWSWRSSIAVFLTRFALLDRWRLLPTRANGQLAFGAYAWEPDKACYTPLSLDVLTLEGTTATDITSFATPHTRGPDRQRFATDVFGRFGLPAQLD